MVEYKYKNFLPGTLRYIVGDATLPRGGGHRLLIHGVNDQNKWGQGFVLALSKRWKKPEEQYRMWGRAQILDRVKFQMGEIQLVEVQSDLTVVNMITDTLHTGDGSPPASYKAIRSCLQKVAKVAKDRQSSVHGPRFGSGLGGADWNEIELIIKEELLEKSINVTIYDLEPAK